MTHQNPPAQRASASRSLVFVSVLILLVGALIPGPAQATSFTDVAQSAGINTSGPTAASAWGDANADGWPDLWVSNHHGRAPHLFLNQSSSTQQARVFVDAVHQLSLYSEYSGDTWPDFHGAAWADYDNDGDQDLIVVTGAGAGRGTSANYLFENSAGAFVNRAPNAGIEYDQGRGRTPLWLDANADGKLDLLVMNKPRKNAPSRLFIQQPNDGFTPEPRFEAEVEASWWQDATDWLAELFGFSEAPLVAATEFAQLLTVPRTDTQDGLELQLIAFGKDSQRRGLSERAYKQLPLPDHPEVKGIQDAAFADFNGDLAPDWLLLRALPFVRDVTATSPQTLRAVLNGSTEKPAGLHIIADASLTLELHRPWMDPSDPRSAQPLAFQVGDQPRTTMQPLVMLSKDEASTSTAPDLNKEHVAIHYSPETSTWHVVNTAGALNVIATTSTPFSDWETSGFKPAKGAATSVVLFANSASDTELSMQDHSSLPKLPCQSVVAADFDNDTDIDAYLVCTHPTENTADVLLLNDGTGKFTALPQTSQSTKDTKGGRGNQASTADFNNDGFVDVAVTNGAGAPPFAEGGTLALLQNNGNANSWLQLQLQGDQSNRDGIGAVITLTSNGVTQRRLQNGGTHSFAQDHTRVHFGLKDAEVVERIEIRWPSGIRQQLNNVSARQILLVKESPSS